jgi:hypothetical protein
MKKIKLNFDQLDVEFDLINAVESNSIKGGDWITDFFNTHGTGVYTEKDWNDPGYGGTATATGYFARHTDTTDYWSNTGAGASSIYDENDGTYDYITDYEAYLDSIYFPSQSGSSGGYGGYGGYSGGISSGGYGPTAHSDDQFEEWHNWADGSSSGSPTNPIQLNEVVIHATRWLGELSQTGRIPDSNSLHEGFNILKAINKLDSNASSTPLGKCAKYVRLALEAGGTNTAGHPVAAANYGSHLTEWGFSAVSGGVGYIPQTGDIAVFPAFTGHPYGHIQMYDGTQWVSDFKQNHFVPGTSYAGQPYQVYRP